jgi:hypothetical protein
MCKKISTKLALKLVSYDITVLLLHLFLKKILGSIIQGSKLHCVLHVAHTMKSYHEILHCREVSNTISFHVA